MSKNRETKNVKCRICDCENLVCVWDVPNHALTKQLSKTRQKCKTWHLEVYACEGCGFMQINNPLDQEILYENYLFPTSWKNHPHAHDLIASLVRLENLKAQDIDSQDSHGCKILEIGCNDGSFLQNLSKALPKSFALGIEPSSDVYELAQAKGLQVRNEFFNFSTSQNLKAQYGSFDLIYSRHVFEHIEDIPSFLHGVRNLAHKDSIIMIEVPNCQSAIKRGDMSFIWEEHVSYFTPAHLEFVLQKHGLKVFERAQYEFSGESFVCFARLDSEMDIDSHYLESLRESFTPYFVMQSAESLDFPQANQYYINNILTLIKETKDSGGEILAYGGGHSMIDFINLFAFSYVDYVVDDQEQKQGYFLPASSDRDLQSQKQILSFDEALKRAQGRIKLVFLGTYKENEEKTLQKCRSVLSFETRYIPLYTPSNLT